MAGDDGLFSGSDEAHTLGKNPGGADPERAAKVGATRAIAEAAMSGLAGQLAGDEPEDIQPSLLLADPDGDFCLFGGPVQHVADTIAEGRRARGRPKGSQNRRSQDLANYLLSMGYRDPALNLADLANATPGDLAAELSEPYRPKSGEYKGQLVERSMTPGEAMKLIMAANEALMPFFHAKRPQEIAVTTRTMGIMMIGEMPTEQAASEEVMDLTRVAPPK